MSPRAIPLIIALLLGAPPALAATAPHPSGGDPRVQVVTYDPDEVVELSVRLGFQLSVAFDPAERIENVAVGDALGWQITPNRHANLLFLKPMSRRPATNMTVLTNLRRYDFRLSVAPARRRRMSAYSVRFDYPPPVAPVVSRVAETSPPPPQDLNHAYSYDGSARMLPIRVFDDGKSTYFSFAPDQDRPAILAVEADGGEAVVNTSSRDGYVVVDRIERGFVLRRGSEVTKLYNDGYREPQPGPLSPKPRPRKKGIFGR